MLLMSNNLTTETNQLSGHFRVTDKCDLLFSVQGLTGGAVSIEFSPNNGTDWYDLDSTNLEFSASGNKVAEWGECLIRAAGDSATGTVKVWIGGKNVTPPSGS